MSWVFSIRWKSHPDRISCYAILRKELIKVENS
jgi:hypothetical protein